MSQLKLLKHQSDILNHLNRCEKQHGILIYHGTGTGKTLIGLGFMLTHIDEKILLILPAVIKANWAYEFDKVGMADYFEKIKIISYDELYLIKQLKLEDYNVIIDEGHNLVLRIKQLNDSSYIRLLMKTKKALILSATPVIDNDLDLIILLNITAGKEVIPFSDDKFNKEYRIIKSKSKSAVFGWVIPTLASGFLSKVYGYNMYPVILLKLIGEVTREPKYISLANKIDLSSHSKIITGASKYIAKFYAKILSIPSERIDPTQMFTLITSLNNVLFTWILTAIQILAKFCDKYQVYDIYEYNDSKILNSVNPYISYYKASDTDPNYPKNSIEYIKSSYNAYQIIQWFNACMNKDLRISNDILNTNITNNIYDYMHKGRIIGNYSNLKELSKTVEKITSKTNSSNKSLNKSKSNSYSKSGHSSLSNSKNNDKVKEASPKFLKVLELMKKVDYKRVVIYSSFFEDGIEQFAKFLDSHDLDYKIIHKDISDSTFRKIISDFKNGDINIILLHPHYTEGISIFGANQMHILEPILDNNIYMQLIGRVNRYQSHIHLPENKRYINIFVHYCTANEVLKYTLFNKERSVQWLKYYPGVHINKIKEVFSSELTPDAMIINLHKKNNVLLSVVQKNVIKNCG